ncbi:RecX family transcriptional regulator [Photobacterium leiognathi]|uniref:RecX family transcriptional regulator n=1 Tax=Photobacterium leiognathi TaxID=553611 RepID=UPI001EDF91BC|nr:RecX family transcriptional regulator [Photobacterium leiognathi]MCG3884424.1 RecX family transcriptional regulator [Photobacterium leiognathi]
MNIAVYHLSIKDYMIGELISKLERNVVEFNGDKTKLITDVINKLKDFGYIKEDIEFGERFAHSAISNEYGLGYIRTELSKKGMNKVDIETVIESTLVNNTVDFNLSAKNRLMNRYQNGFNGVSREKVQTLLRKWGFTTPEVRFAMESHPKINELKTKIEISGAKADLEKEVIKLAKKLKGLSAIRIELIKKRISTDGLEELISKLENENKIDFFDSAVRRLSKKRYDITDRKSRASAYSFLASNGFTSEQINYALNHEQN